ncbi:MAG TPA: BatD family protein, partial [Bacteroidales bacterium]|nr:BatD family protein [Bacteroidales bacterium]
MKSILTAMICLLVTLTGMTQEIVLTVDAPEAAATGERFRIIYTVNSTDGQFTPPKFDQSFSVQGPQQSTSRNVQWINGDIQTVSSTTLIYYVVASVQGTYTIPPAQFTTKKITVSSPERQIVITDGPQSQVPAARQPQSQGQAAGTGDTPSSGSEVSMRLLLTDREVYAGEPITVTLKLY